MILYERLCECIYPIFCASPSFNVSQWPQNTLAGFLRVNHFSYIGDPQIRMRIADLRICGFFGFLRILRIFFYDTVVRYFVLQAAGLHPNNYFSFAYRLSSHASSDLHKAQNGSKMASSEVLCRPQCPQNTLDFHAILRFCSHRWATTPL